MVLTCLLILEDRLPVPVRRVLLTHRRPLRAASLLILCTTLLVKFGPGGDGGGGGRDAAIISGGGSASGIATATAPIETARLKLKATEKSRRGDGGHHHHAEAAHDAGHTHKSSVDAGAGAEAGKTHDHHQQQQERDHAADADVAFATVDHPAYTVVSTDHIGEYGANATLYIHDATRAQLLSLSTDDTNKAFGITFRTPPSDSTGVPHIIEHSLLCGSRQYRTKDPFVDLLKGSLQTFLNAMTFPDRTAYVIASQNVADFHNLVNVYADAAFHPRAVRDPRVLMQEGWHLELEDVDDTLTYKGVVYNEMKGVYSSADSLLERASQRSLFPDNAYRFDSGGDPKIIPELTFDQFKDFYTKFYHPANSRIYFAGDDDVGKRLELMDEYLRDLGGEEGGASSAAQSVTKGSEISWQKKIFTEPKRERLPYPTGGGDVGEHPTEEEGDQVGDVDADVDADADDDDTHMISMSWLINDEPITATDELTLNVLDHLLLGTPSSILRKKLVESGLGTALTGDGLEDELLQATFSVGLKGIKPENVEKVEHLILATLEKVAEDGFEDDAIAASMNTIEFHLREFNTGSFPKGLALMMASMAKWIYDGSPTEALKFERPLAELKAEIALTKSKVFQDVISKVFVKNHHRTTVEMVPSKTLEAELIKEEEDRLAAIKESLSDDELRHIVNSTIELKNLQAAEDSPEDKATIPRLTLADLDREVSEYPIEVSPNEASSGVTVVRHELGSTSGVAYVDFGVDVSVLSLSDALLLPLLLRIMKEAGAGDYDDVALSRVIGTHTGGISMELVTALVRPEGVEDSEVIDGSKMQTKIFFRGKALSHEAGELFSIMRIMLTEARLDSQTKVIEMLKEEKAGLESDIQESGHSYVNTRLRSKCDASGYIQEKMGGISYLKSVTDLLKQAQDDWPSLLARLEAMRATILGESTCRDGMILNLTGDKNVLEAIEQSVAGFLTELPGDSEGTKFPNFNSVDHPWVTEALKEMETRTTAINEGFIVPTQVSYVGKGGKLYDPGDTVKGSAMTVSRYLKTGYLWDHVRVIGGAYGGFCTFSPDLGFFSYLSYRDPNLAQTLDVYDAAPDDLMAASKDLAANPEALETAIIGTIGDMDGALSPDQKGWVSLIRHLKGESPQKRQKFRDEVLGTKPDDFDAFAVRLGKMKCQSVAVVSSKAAFEEAAEAGRKLNLTNVF